MYKSWLKQNFNSRKEKHLNWYNFAYEKQFFYTDPIKHFLFKRVVEMLKKKTSVGESFDEGDLQSSWNMMIFVFNTLILII